MNLQERTETTHPNVDAANRTLRGVAILNRESRNRRTYSDTALDDCARLAENSRVFIDHLRGHETRSARDLAGVLSNAKRIGGRVVADLSVLGGRAWELLSDVASRGAHALGLSIDAQGTMEGRTVTGLTDLKSVDLVTAPASTSGLFESRNGGSSERNTMNEHEDEFASLEEAWCEGDGDTTRIFSRPTQLARVAEGEADEEDANLLAAWSGRDDDGDDW